MWTKSTRELSSPTFAIRGRGASSGNTPAISRGFEISSAKSLGCRPSAGNASLFIFLCKERVNFKYILSSPQLGTVHGLVATVHPCLRSQHSLPTSMYELVLVVLVEPQENNDCHHCIVGFVRDLNFLVLMSHVIVLDLLTHVIWLRSLPLNRASTS